MNQAVNARVVVDTYPITGQKHRPVTAQNRSHGCQGRANYYHSSIGPGTRIDLEHPACRAYNYHGRLDINEWYMTRYPRNRKAR